MIVIGLQHVLGDAEGVLLPGRAVFEWCILFSCSYLLIGDIDDLSSCRVQIRSAFLWLKF